MSRVKTYHKQSQQRGFTFVLVIISVVIIGIITASIISLESTMVKREKEQELIYRLDKVRTALTEFKKKYNKYPSHLEELLVNKYIRSCYLTDPITGKEWESVIAPISEGYGIKDIHSSSEDISIKLKNVKEAGYKEF